MSESKEELLRTAAAHGWDFSSIDIFDLLPVEARLDRQQTVFHPAELELTDTIRLITDRVAEVNPERLVIDSLSDLRLLASDPLVYRRQILALKQFLIGRSCTTLFLNDRTTENVEREMHSVAHGVIVLEQIERMYGASRRRLCVVKMRGADYQSGWHDFVITKPAILVFPSLIAEEHKAEFKRETLPSGIRGLDDLTGGGIDRGTVTMLVGPSGVGKSTLALGYAMNAVKAGEHVAYFSFDETYATFIQRGTALGFDAQTASELEKFSWRRANPSRLSPGEFTWQVRRQVEECGARFVIIDSLNSYFSTMPEEQSLILHMHELLSYLNNIGCITLLVLAQEGIVGDVSNPVNLSFLSDGVILMRYYEAAGEVRKAISMVKKRSGVHDRTIREFELDAAGMRIGQALTNLSGVLTGVPARCEPAPARTAESPAATTSG